MKPWMLDEEILIYQSIIALRDPEKRCDVLEWGAGGSTAHFPRVLESVGCPRSWLTIDHDEIWVEKARAASPTWVEFLHVPTGGDRRQPEMWADYIDPPALADRLFDLILVDGRMRRRCLERAATLLRDDDALVILHDADRPYYHPAFARFAAGRFLGSRVWVGHRRIDVERANPR
jgi:hypothetical protein